MKELTTIIGGTLRVGDVITLGGVPYYPWYKIVWYAIRYMRHNNPIYKPVELKEFTISWSNDSGNIYGIEP